jgi:hypothetical protein
MPFYVKDVVSLMMLSLIYKCWSMGKRCIGITKSVILKRIS